MELRGPGEVYERLIARRTKMNIDTAIERQTEYKKQQVYINKNIRETFNPSEEMPPCCDCNPLVFCYCDDNELECKKFLKYTNFGKNDN